MPTSIANENGCAGFTAVLFFGVCLGGTRLFYALLNRIFDLLQIFWRNFRDFHPFPMKDASKMARMETEKFALPNATTTRINTAIRTVKLILTNPLEVAHSQILLARSCRKNGRIQQATTRTTEIGNGQRFFL